jgi:DNA-binding response OmpR family regulator
MIAMTRREHILLVDYQTTWLERSARSLESCGFTVRSVDTYRYPPNEEADADGAPDLIVLGCASIGPDEQRFIKQVIDSGKPLVVLCSLLSPQVMRSLFLAGAQDVTRKPNNAAELVALVSQTL